MAYALDKQAEAERKKQAEGKEEDIEAETADSYFISEIKVLFSDAETRDIFSDTYAEARVDAKKFRFSELGNLYQTISKEVERKEDDYKRLEKDLHLGKIAGEGRVSSAKSRMARLADNLDVLNRQKKEMEELDGMLKTAENTDAAANFQYEKLKNYKEQLDKGFVWLPSRKKIHQKTVSAVLNHRWPVLIGEAGSGKSDQADAAAIELTGYLPTEIECESTTGETQLIKDAAIDDSKTGGSYENYGSLMRAFTGYDDSRQKEPEVKTGRIARFDESGRLGPKAYSIIKKARQKSRR